MQFVLCLTAAAVATMAGMRVLLTFVDRAKNSCLT